MTILLKFRIGENSEFTSIVLVFKFKFYILFRTAVSQDSDNPQQTEWLTSLLILWNESEQSRTVKVE